jgi:hypothetical protein
VEGSQPFRQLSGKPLKKTESAPSVALAVVLFFVFQAACYGFSAGNNHGIERIRDVVGDERL